MPEPGSGRPMTDLTGKVAIVTGGASGIGAATVRRLAAAGASVLVADLDDNAGLALADQLGDPVAFLRTNVTIEADVSDMVSEAVDRFGGLDILFNNAGFGGALGPLRETSVEDFDLTFDVLLKSVFLGIKHGAPAIAERGGGSIINTASIASLRPGYAPHLYSTAKAAVLYLTETAALELAVDQVRCNAVCPGVIATPLYAGRPDATEEQIDQARAASASMQPLGRIGEPADIASMVMFLVSDEAAWVTGQRFVVDGGISAGPRWDEFPEPFRVSRPIRHHRPPGR